MRLTPRERETLRQSAQASFGPDVAVRLFGSRVDASRRGGDIDLLIETRLDDPAQIARAHTHFLSLVYRELGEQKIDVLIDYPRRSHRPPIFDIARQQGVEL